MLADRIIANTPAVGHTSFAFTLIICPPFPQLRRTVHSSLCVATVVLTGLKYSVWRRRRLLLRLLTRQSQKLERQRFPLQKIGPSLINTKERRSEWSTTTPAKPLITILLDFQTAWKVIQWKVSKSCHSKVNIHTAQCFDNRLATDQTAPASLT